MLAPPFIVGVSMPREAGQRLDGETRGVTDYQRNGLTSLYAALEVASGRVIGDCAPRHTGTDFLRFIQRVARRYRGRELHVVLDNSSTHSTPAVQAWLAQHPAVQFHFTPKGASWLNMVEAWFGIFTRKSVRRGSFDTVRALVRHIDAYIAEWNRHPTPFVWTKDPAVIIKKARKSLCLWTRRRDGRLLEARIRIGLWHQRFRSCRSASSQSSTFLPGHSPRDR